MIGNKVNRKFNIRGVMNKIKISEAFLRNCEGFMFEQVLLDKIDTYLKTDHEHGMTLKGLTNVFSKRSNCYTRGW